MTIDLARHVVTRGGEEVHLTPTEFDLLRVLATEADKVLTHRQILERVWGGYAAENSQQLRVYINYLRRKLEDDPTHPRLIVTEPGVGYRLRRRIAPTADRRRPSVGVDLVRPRRMQSSFVEPDETSSALDGRAHAGRAPTECRGLLTSRQ